MVFSMATKKTTATNGVKPRSSTGTKTKTAARTTTRKTTGTAAKRSSGGRKRTATPKRTAAEMQYYIKRSRFVRGIVLLCMAGLFTLLFFMQGEKIWRSLHDCCRGIFGFFGFLIPLILIYCAVQMFHEESTYRFPLKVFFLSGTVFMLATVVYTFSSSGMALQDYGNELINCYYDGYLRHGVGFIGGILGIPLAKMFGSVAGGLLATIILLFFLYMSFETLFLNLADKVKAPVSERISEQREIRTRVREETQKIKQENRQRAHEEYVNRKVTEKVEAAKKRTADSEYRRINKTPIYEPDSRPSSAAPSAAKPAAVPVGVSGGIKGVVPDMSPRTPALQTKTAAPSTPPAEKADDTYPDMIDIAALLQKGKQSSPAASGGYRDTVHNTPAAGKPTPTTGKPPAPAAAKPTANAADPKQPSEPVKPASNPNPVVEGHYIKPPFVLLEQPQDEPEENISQELHQTATKLVDTLKSFGVQTTIMNISRGPSVTRYELQPASGVKISKITNLADDIAMNLAAMGVRIEAPIPGKNAVGIEVPNKHITTVKMRSLVESPEFQNAKSKLTVALGEDITGNITLADLSKMPHLLIAGSTGSGKSVCINAMLISLLYKADPDEVKLILIDPKVVELGVYNGIPHLLVPVVTDPRKAAGALNWAVNEMLERYKSFAECNVRDIHSYNRLVDKQNAEAEESDLDDADRTFEEDEMLAQAQAELQQDNGESKEKRKRERMSQVVIVIDELADLMMAAPNEVEESICRLAQMARAAGMHLVIATQRPSVDVITGLIKANVPSRIAFAVKSQIDSRTILDGSGAEKLLGKGDMLFSPIGTTKPVRVQGCYVDDEEIENIVTFIKNNKVVEYDKRIIDEIEAGAVAEPGSKSADSGDDSNTDPMMEQAIQCVVEAGQASTSLLQRRLRLGYARAGRLIDEMEQIGIVGPHEGSKPRQVLMTYQQWLERSMTLKDTE